MYLEFCSVLFFWGWECFDSALSSRLGGGVKFLLRANAFEVTYKYDYIASKVSRQGYSRMKGHTTCKLKLLLQDEIFNLL